MSAKLYKADAPRLLKIAEMVDQEALSWLEGFAATTPQGQYVWNGEWPEQHARHIRLQSAAEFLRKLASRADSATDGKVEQSLEEHPIK